MKVILLQDIKSVGKKGQILDASDGYARNYLLPKKLAVLADATNLNELKTKQDANKYKRDMTMANAKELVEKMKTFELRFKIKAGENGKTFGSVTAKDIADELNKKLLEYKSEGDEDWFATCCESGFSKISLNGIID